MTASRGKRLGLLALCAIGILLFGSLGVWQVQRLGWKRDLIARVDSRIHAEPVSLPPRAEWSRLEPHDVEYRRVQLHGHFLYQHDTLVDAVTELGDGWWVLTPLESDEGLVWVNRGFVPREQGGSIPGTQGKGEVQVTGLLRRTEPEGRILRPNRPEEARWFSRDVQAMAAARGLGEVAPFFIDAVAQPGSNEWPRGGMTVVTFRNAHLSYALTWFGLAGLCAAGGVLVLRDSPSA